VLVLTRHSVPADNACLFTAVGYVARGGEHANAVRRLAADTLAAAPADADEYSTAALGKPRAEYIEDLLRPSTWGGAIELGILATRLALELVAIEVKSGRPYRFGAGLGFARRAFLIFDGAHYDAVHCESSSGGVPQTTFPAEDEAPLAAAIAIAAELKRTRQYVDFAGFALMCENRLRALRSRTRTSLPLTLRIDACPPNRQHLQRGLDR
jgi:ubiquitin thioesterase OTU1